MANSREILLKLVRMAMGWETDFSLPEDVDWKDVLTIAQEQGVNAIAVDGLEVYMNKQPQGSPAKNSAVFKQILLEAIGGLQMVEYNYMNHVAALTELSEILSKKEIPFMIMKGFACGQYYPNPKHRPCGDIDIYPGERFEESNQALKAAGVDSDPYYYRHSASYIKNVMIENHRVLGDLRGYRKQSRLFEEQLEKEAKQSILEGKNVEIEGREIKGAKYPLADFNVLFLPWHVSAHFAFEKVTIRHLLDWALFLVNEGKDVSVEKFKTAKMRYTHGYKKMADILTNLSIRYLYMPTDTVPNEIVNDAIAFDSILADKVFDYMFVGQPRERDANVWKFRWNNLKRVWKERWKYREVYDMSMAVFLYQKAMGVIFKEGEE